MDCLYSFANLAQSDGFIKPKFFNENESQEIFLSESRNPILEPLIQNGNGFVPNDIHLKEGKEECMIITGPNMGGKSVYIKQIALIAIMAQIGCFVPAKEAKLSIFDSIFTRMGARDDIQTGESTFMVELSEASEILNKATNKSLVILDELGRGTSTHDGTSIAYCTLQYIIENIKAFTLFVTHYPMITTLENVYPTVGNYHMDFFTHEEDEDECEADDGDELNKNKNKDAHWENNVTFLFKIVKGFETRSYGLNVAKLAGLDKIILKNAKKMSKSFEEKVRSNAINFYYEKLKKISKNVININTKNEMKRIAEGLNSFFQGIN